MTIEGWSFLDSLFMAIITLSPAGMVWTIGVCIVAVIFGTVGVAARA